MERNFGTLSGTPNERQQADGVPGSEIKGRIREFVTRNLLFSENGFPYSDDDSFLGQRVVDSLGVIELVAFVEREFRVAVNPAEVTPDNFDSVDRLAGFIRQKVCDSKEVPCAGP
jgi:acyl carrier protein